MPEDNDTSEKKKKKSPEDYAETDSLYRGDRLDGIKHMLSVSLG